MRAMRWRRWLWRWRFVLTAALLALAVLLVLQELRPPAPPTHEVLTAAEDIPAGHEVTEADVHTQLLPEPPPESVDLDDVVGGSTTVAIPAGLPIVPSLLSGPGIASDAPPGHVVAPIHVADADMVPLLQIGDRVDLYQADPGSMDTEADLITSEALVMGLPHEQDEGGLLDTGADFDENSTIVVAIAAEHASVLTGASGVAPFRMVWSSATVPS